MRRNRALENKHFLGEIFETDVIYGRRNRSLENTSDFGERFETDVNLGSS